MFSLIHPSNPRPPETNTTNSSGGGSGGGATKNRRSSCDAPDQHQNQQHPHQIHYGTSTSGTDQGTATSSISATTSAGEGDDDFESPGPIKYKLIASGANFSRTTTASSSSTKGQVNIITNPLVRQYPIEANYKIKKHYANETIVTHQPGGNLKTISYVPGAGGAGAGAPGTANVDMKRSPLLNRRRSSSVTLPQPPVERHVRVAGGESGEAPESRTSR